MTSFSKALKLHPNWCSQHTASFCSSRRILSVSGQIRQNYPNLCLQMGNQSSFRSWGENTAIFLRNCVKIKISLFFSVHTFSWVFTTLDVWLAKSTRIIHHNQLLMTKFGRILCLTRKWRQKCRPLQLKAPLTEKTWGRGWVVLVVKTKWPTLHSFEE